MSPHTVTEFDRMALYIREMNDFISIPWTLHWMGFCRNDELIKRIWDMILDARVYLSWIHPNYIPRIP